MRYAAPILLSVLTGVASYAQSNRSVTRDGPYWVYRTEGNLTCPPSGRFVLQTRASIVVRGEAGPRITYQLTERVKARTSMQAERMLEAVRPRTMVRGDLTTLILVPPSLNTMSAELRLNVPRTLREAVFTTFGGDVEAYDLDGVVQVDTAAGRIQVDRLGSQVIATTGGGEIRVGKVKGQLRCISKGGSIRVDSAGGETWCDTAGGDIIVREAAGPLHASTGGGNVQVDHAASSVSARSEAGLIQVQQAGGLVTAATQGGSIEVGGARGVSCESAVGTIRLQRISGAVRVSTAAGSILAQLLSGEHLEDSFLNSGAGDIRVMIPSNLAVSIQARNDSVLSGKRIYSDFPEIRVQLADSGRSRPATAEGALNGGGPLLRITASGGIIYLQRQK